MRTPRSGHRFAIRATPSMAGSETEMAIQSRVLVVEDHALNLKLVRDVLRHAGFDGVEARSGRMGLRAPLNTGRTSS
jgi:PleD family two-component response regulator